MAAIAGAGGIGGTVTVADQSIESVVPSPALATATLTLNTNGTLDVNGVYSADYCAPTSIAAQLEAKLTVLTGTFSGSAAGSWLALTSTRAWYIQQSGVGSNAASGTLEIREAVSGLVRDSASIDLYAEVFA